MLHEYGAEPEVIARHLVGAEWAEAEWARPALYRAADQATASGRPDITSACLRLTQRQSADSGSWTPYDGLLLRSRWQINPLSAATDLAALAAADGPDGCPPAALTGRDTATRPARSWRRWPRCPTRTP